MDILKRKILGVEVLADRESAMAALLSDPDNVLILTAEEQRGRGKPRLRYRCRSISSAILGEKVCIGQLLDPESGNVILKITLEK